jgi:transposase-like protein
MARSITVKARHQLRSWRVQMQHNRGSEPALKRPL